MTPAVVGKLLAYVGGKLLAYVEDDVRKDWAASVQLGPNVEALQLELLAVKAVLQSTMGKDIQDNSALKELLVMLQDLGYDAEDVLDEMDYFRIQDQMDSTFHAADKHAADNLAFHVHHTAAAAVGKLMLCLPSSLPASASSASCHTVIRAIGKCFPCSPLPIVHGDDDDQHDDEDNHTNNEPAKLRFKRTDASKRIDDIAKKLRIVHERVSSISATLGSNKWTTTQNIAQSRPTTTSKSIEPRLYGRGQLMTGIIHDITKGRYSTEVLTVIPILGPGGIGKTTLAQKIFYQPEVEEHFHVSVWKCVSLNFNVDNLIEDIQRKIPKVNSNESTNDTASDLIGERLRNKRLLLVLDDIWDCSDEDEWKKLLVPFKSSQAHGNIIIATTRFPAQARIMDQKNDHSVCLQGLDTKEFEELFLEIIFGNDDKLREDHKFLIETGIMIAGRLKGSPLAAKTVGRLLKTQLDLDHWTSILKSKEWEHSSGKNDIMPALKLSFDYLPSQLQQCFSYCALFPQDYEFERQELINFWIGQEVLHLSHGENKRVEDIGLSCLTGLVNYGFFLENKGGRDERTCYIIHDLLHELARKVSSLECLTIDSSQCQVSSLQVPPSIRHLSINIDDTSARNRLTLKNCVENFNTLGARVKVEKLRTLMIFGEHHGCFVKAFGYLFREAKALRVIFLSNASYDVEDLLCNFYNLLHLRYLRIHRFPSQISRFYHMMVIDAKWCDIIDLPRDITKLQNLRHFLVQTDAMHSRIVEVGKLKLLQELRRFVVKHEGQGFELREIGKLGELCGSLCISNLERVQVKEEADEAKLMQKNRLRELILHWNNLAAIFHSDIDQSTYDSTLEENVLERLNPSSNLRKLSIIGHGGNTCPSWLGTNLSIKNLESLCLDGVAWRTFPPIGELWLVNAPREGIVNNVANKRFANLRRLELVNLLSLRKWAIHAPRHLFPFLEVLVIGGCPNLEELSFSQSTCCEKKKEVDEKFPPKLSELNITNCPQLLSFPPVPWTDAPCSIKIEGIGHSCLDKLVCREDYDSSQYRLKINGRGALDGTLWDVLAFDNLSRVKKFELNECQPLPLHRLQMLSSLRTLEVNCRSDALPFVDDDSQAEYQFPVDSLIIKWWSGSGKELTQLLTYFQNLSDLELSRCDKRIGLGVWRQQEATVTLEPPSSTYKVEQDTIAEDEIGATAADGLLLLPPQLQRLQIFNCRELSVVPTPLNAEKGGGGAGLQGLRSLRWLFIGYCPKLLSSYSSTPFSTCFAFPNSLEYLNLRCVEGMRTLVSLSNLTSLTRLSIYKCEDLICKGLLSLLVQGHLTELQVMGTPSFFVVPDEDLPSSSFKLQILTVDHVPRFTATPARCSLFSSLATLDIFWLDGVEHLTPEQEALLFVSSLNAIKFMYCSSLQYLPARLHTLPNLKKLRIEGCKAIQMLPPGSLPSSLQELVIDRCPEIQSLECLPRSLQKLEIRYCPAIRSLPEMPAPLRELDVSDSGSKELRSQCCELINIIPIVRA